MRLALLLTLLWATLAQGHLHTLVPVPELVKATDIDVNGRPHTESAPYLENSICQHPTFIYGVTGPTCAEALWHDVAHRHDSVVFYVTWETECKTSAAKIRYSHNPNATWTQNRNFIANVISKYERKQGCYAPYHVYADSDTTLQISPPGRLYQRLNKLKSTIDVLHDRVLKLTPLIAIPRLLVWRHNSPKPEEQPMTLQHFDAVMNFMSPLARQIILPYDEFFEQESIWASQEILFAHIDLLYYQANLEIQDVILRNDIHRKYPKGHDWPRYYKRGIANVEKKFGVTCHPRSSNVTIEMLGERQYGGRQVPFPWPGTFKHPFKTHNPLMECKHREF